jgi:hypothetical protein
MNVDNALAAGRRGCISVSAPRDAVCRRPFAAPPTQAKAPRPQIAPRRKTIIQRVQAPAQNFGHSFSKKRDLPWDGLSAKAPLTQATARRPQIEPRKKTIIKYIQLLARIFGHSFSRKHDLPLDDLTAKVLRDRQRIPNETLAPAVKQAKAPRQRAAARSLPMSAAMPPHNGSRRRLPP